MVEAAITKANKEKEAKKEARKQAKFYRASFARRCYFWLRTRKKSQYANICQIQTERPLFLWF
jgi:hypothetical protein